MIVSAIKIRVRYGETDRMGFVYYGNYATYFEVARVELLRELGISYKVLEDSGISLPVVDFKIKYIKPAYYDDLLTVKTTVATLPSTRIHFSYETFNGEGVLLNIAETTLVFVNIKIMKPIATPSGILEKMQRYFK